jgi:hypothetical protein
MQLLDVNTQPTLNYDPTLRQRMLRETEEYLNRHSHKALLIQNRDFEGTPAREACCFLSNYPRNQQVSWA